MLAVLDGRASEARDRGNEGEAAFAETMAAGLRGYRDLKTGNAARARTSLEQAQGRVTGVPDNLIRLWLAEANEELGRTREAIRWYGLLRSDALTTSFSRYKVAKLAQEVGDPTLAREAWEAFLVNYAEAEPDNPRLAEARAALASLGG